jgi:hypothetical protein
MKFRFTSDGYGWRDLELADADDTETKFSICIPTKKCADADARPFLVTSGGECVTLSHKNLRKLAYKILKEIDR